MSLFQFDALAFRHYFRYLVWIINSCHILSLYIYSALPPTSDQRAVQRCRYQSCSVPMWSGRTCRTWHRSGSGGHQRNTSPAVCCCCVALRACDDIKEIVTRVCSVLTNLVLWKLGVHTLTTWGFDLFFLTSHGLMSSCQVKVMKRSSRDKLHVSIRVHFYTNFTKSFPMIGCQTVMVKL